MNDRLERVRMLLATERYRMAEDELAAVIAEDPSNPFAHALLATCRSLDGRHDAALVAADEAVALGPDEDVGHAARAHALGGLERYGEAETAIREAIRLDPADADHPAWLASLHLARRRYPDALAAADAALALDAEHLGATNLRGIALVQLGRRDEAARTVEGALARDPDDGMAHAALGWTHLNSGRAKDARRHFEEALRLDPGNEAAREGLVESIKASNFVYRWLLLLFLRLSRLSTGAQLVVLVGFWYGRKALHGLRDTHPALAPYLTPVLWLLGALVVISWIGVPLADLVLRLHPVGRKALSPARRRTSNAVGLLLLGALVAAFVWWRIGATDAFVALVVFASLVLPAPAVFGTSSFLARALGIAVSVFGLLVLAGALLPVPLVSSGLFVAYVWTIVGYTWVSPLLDLAQQPR